MEGTGSRPPPPSKSVVPLVGIVFLYLRLMRHAAFNAFATRAHSTWRTSTDHRFHKQSSRLRAMATRGSSCALPLPLSRSALPRRFKRNRGVLIWPETPLITQCSLTLFSISNCVLLRISLLFNLNSSYLIWLALTINILRTNLNSIANQLL